MPPAVPLHYLVLLPLVLASVGYFLPRRGYHALLGLGHGLTVAMALALFIRVRWGAPLSERLADWPLGIAIRLVADSISAPLALLTALFFAGAFLFSTRAGYLDKTFLFLFTTLESALLGVFLSGDLFNVYVLIELGMLIVAILIMYQQDRQSVYDAMLYLMINFIAMAFMLLGIGYLYRLTGVLDFGLLAERLPQLGGGQRGAVAVPYALILTALAVKSALFPLFSWLPRAHGAPSAPAVVSAVLSGVQVKAGVYLLIRMTAVFGPTIDVRPFFMALGMITAIVGFLLAIAQKDIKLILAYHTVSQIGLIVMGLFMGTEIAYWGGLYHMVNHALFKGLLFLTAGVIIERYGSRSCLEIRGVLRRMPAIGIATLAGVLGITGAPLFNGSISKYFIQQGLQGDLAGVGLFLINLGTTVSFVKYVLILFGSPRGMPPGRVREPVDPWVALVALVFGFACLAGGLFGGHAVALVFGRRYAVAGALAPGKLLAFAGTLLLAVGLYRGLVCRAGAFFAELRAYKLSFNQITVCLTLFFLALLAAMA